MGKRLTVALAIAALALLLLLSGCVTQKPSLQEIFAKKPSDTNKATAPDRNASGPQTPGQQPGQTTPQQDLEIGVAMDACLEDPNPAKADTCLLELAKKNKNDAPCEQISLLSKDRCFIAVGVAAKSDYYCGKISNGTVLNECLRQVATATKNSETCLKIVSDYGARDSCLDTVARGTKDAEACLEISDERVKDPCLIAVASSKKDYSICESVSERKDSKGFLRDQCFNPLKVKLAGELCVKILDPELRAKCFQKADDIPAEHVDCSAFSDSNSFNNCNYWQGSFGGSVNSCYALTNNKGEECLYSAVDVNAEIENCNLVKSAEYEIRNTCYWNAAVALEDRETCDLIVSDSAVKDDCIMDIAVLKENEQLCFDIKANNISDRDLCISRIALSTGNYTKCEIVQTDQAYYRCFAEVALSFGAHEICSQAERLDLRLLPYAGKEYCFKEYAVLSENDAVCNNISFSSLEAQCNAEVEVAVTCKDNDKVCDESLCSYVNDNDCKSPDYCDKNVKCNDNRVSTKDTCNVKAKSCVYTQIGECINNDRYCPGFCTYTGDPNATIRDEATNKTNEDSDCLKPCSLAGGTLCGGEKPVCPPENQVFAIEGNCCEIHPDEEETYCTAEQQ